MSWLFDKNITDMDDLVKMGLYRSYENCYWCLIDSTQKHEQEPRDFLAEDISDCNETLKALEHVIKYYSTAAEDVDGKLLQVQKKVDSEFESKYYKALIAEMNNESVG